MCLATGMVPLIADLDTRNEGTIHSRAGRLTFVHHPDAFKLWVKILSLHVHLDREVVLSQPMMKLNKVLCG